MNITCSWSPYRASKEMEVFNLLSNDKRQTLFSVCRWTQVMN